MSAKEDIAAPPAPPGATSPANRRETIAGFGALMIGLGAPVAAWGAGPPARSFFAPAERALLTALADTIIPATDTPGAVAVGVPRAFDAMMTGWASRDHGAAVRASLAALGRALDRRGGRAFAGAPAAARLATLAAFDAGAYGAQRAEHAGYREIKGLIVKLYYTSEAGASVELQYDPIPGVWLACARLSEIGRTWAT